MRYGRAAPYSISTCGTCGLRCNVALLLPLSACCPSRLCQHGMKYKVSEEVASREARHLITIAARSGNTRVFNKAMETVLMRGKVKLTRTPANGPRVRG